MAKKSSSSLGQEEHSCVGTISASQTEIKTEVARLFDSFGFLSEIPDHVLHYLFATSAFFQEDNRMVKLECMREGTEKKEEIEEGEKE